MPHGAFWKRRHILCFWMCPSQSEVLGVLCCLHHSSQSPKAIPTNPTIKWGGLRVLSGPWDAGLHPGQDGKASSTLEAKAG